MSKDDITVYGAHWCPDCRRSKQFLGEHQIPYNWVNIEEDPEAEQLVIEKNEGKRIIPTIVFSDDTFLVGPQMPNWRQSWDCEPKPAEAITI